jgi:hypothetical protein
LCEEEKEREKFPAAHVVNFQQWWMWCCFAAYPRFCDTVEALVVRDAS